MQILSSSEETLEAQIGLVKGFCEENHLPLNVQKCEVIVFDRKQREVQPVFMTVWRLREWQFHAAQKGFGGRGTFLLPEQWMRAFAGQDELSSSLGALVVFEGI